MRPNWHVVLIHYPVALLTVGLAVEWLTLAYRRGTLRQAGRWMLLIGALSCLPAATSGVYAYYDVVRTAALGERGKEPGGHAWYQLVRGAEQTLPEGTRAVLGAHLWQSAAAGGLLAGAVVVFLGASDRGRRVTYAPLLLGATGAVGVLVFSSWQVREAAGTSRAAAAAAAAEDARLQVHVVLAGVTMALAVAALGRTLRAIAVNREDGLGRPAGEEAVDADPDEPALQTEMILIGEKVRPARVWVAAVVCAGATAAVGLWVASWVDPERKAPIWWGEWAAMLRLPRNLAHAVVGGSVVVLTGVLAALTRWAQGRSGWLALFAGLLVLALAAQVWLGVLLMFDGSDAVSGLAGFRRPAVQAVGEGG